MKAGFYFLKDAHEFPLEDRLPVLSLGCAIILAIGGITLGCYSVQLRSIKGHQRPQCPLCCSHSSAGGDQLPFWAILLL